MTDLAVVCYINSTAELKRYADVCVTSANAVKIVKALPNKTYISLYRIEIWHIMLLRRFRIRHFIYNEGFCPIHEKMRREEIENLKALHPTG